MPASHWTLSAFTVLAVLVGGTRAGAQQPQRQKAPAVIVFPQINTLPAIPAWQINRPVFNPGPFYNPALNNPYLNQTRYVPVPVNPFANQPINNPLFAPVNPFVNDPFALVGPNNAFAPNPFNNPFVPVTNSTPPLAIQQPGQLYYRGADLQVNPASGLVYRPLTGVARTADGSTFFRVAGSGLPTFTGAYAPGTGLYYSPDNNAYLHPASGTISRPGVTNVFLPYIR